MIRKLFMLWVTLALCCHLPIYSQMTSDVDAVPQSFVKPAPNKGKLETLTYDVEIGNKLVKKTAQVYLPYGYDADNSERRYNVLYLAHGGNDCPNSFFSIDRAPIPLNQMADHLIGGGHMIPMIIVSASYYPADNRKEFYSMESTITDCRNFHKELRKYLIPAVGKTYNTYLRTFDDASITATREHRAYGGFSMGALSTWYQIAFDPAVAKYYLPLSGDLWVYDENNQKYSTEKAATWLDAQIRKTPYRHSDFKILAYSGTDDIAYQAEKKLIEMLDQHASLFNYSTNSNQGNLHFSVLSEGVHNYKYVNQYLMDAMPQLWGQTKGGEYWLGADVSGTTMMEARGVKFYNENGEVRENTELMKELGMNAVRLRVWVNPTGGFSSKEDVLKLALRAKEQCMAIMLSFHYSDSWSDPAKQPVPKAWEGYDYNQMKKAVAKHTTETLQLLKRNDIDVKWVQIGNETTHGMLWETGRAETNMKQYAGLTDAGYAAAKKVYPQVTCIVHLDCGADIERYHRIFGGFKKYGTRYDMIGMSVYPYWDLKAKRVKNEWETIEKVVQNIQILSVEYGKDVMIVETGYESLRPNEGYAFMRKLIDSTKKLKECHGIFYWAPELENFYPLGAFHNQRPTMILDAFTEARIGAKAQDTTFCSIVDLHSWSESGDIRGRLYLPHTSTYYKEGKLPAVILSHGFGGTYRETQKFAECLSKHGVAACIFDYCGGSMNSLSSGKTTDMSIFTEKDDLEAVTRTIQSLPNIDADRIMLLGCSQGALVSSLAAANHVNNYQALILVYPALGIPETAKQMLEKTKDTPDEFDFWGMKLSQKYYLPLVDFDPFKEIGKFHKPVFVVYGEKDSITASNHIEKMKAAYKDVSFHVIKDGQHGFPDRFNHRLAETEILEFVRKVLEK